MGNGNRLLTCRTIAESHTHRADLLVREEQVKDKSVSNTVIYQIQEFIEVGF